MLEDIFNFDRMSELIHESSLCNNERFYLAKQQ